MRKEEKNKVIASLVETLNSTSKIYLADCSSLTVEKVNQLRRSCFEKQISLSVVKNSLLEKALERANNKQFAELIPALKGETAMMISEVSNAPAKVIKEFRNKGNDKPLLKGAIVEEMVFLGDSSLDSLVALKSKNELIGDIIGLLQAPAQRVISALQNAKKEGSETAAA
jgi:large subunit ribosomal protein L10